MRCDSQGTWTDQRACLVQVADIEKAEKEKMHDKVKAICAHGINCFVNRQLVYNYPEELFADAGVMAIEHADFDGIERLALVTGVGKGMQMFLPQGSQNQAFLL